jgi:hypothetical protein
MGGQTARATHSQERLVSPSLPQVPFNPLTDAEAQIRRKVRMVAADETTFGLLSSGERIAVALVLDRYDLLQEAWGTMLASVERLGILWTEAALRVQRYGWEDEPS